jgi:bifunctional DNA-binding transcriptional regulator/antitoxin component of YhaV-PrlF toxin-antitoxin module
MTVAIKKKLPVVVPPAALRRAGFKSGQELEVKATAGVITIVPRSPAADDEYTSQERRRIDRGINASLKEYRAGKTAGPFATVEEFLDDLHRESAKLGPKKTTRTRK